MTTFIFYVENLKQKSAQYLNMNNALLHMILVEFGDFLHNCMQAKKNAFVACIMHLITIFMQHHKTKSYKHVNKKVEVYLSECMDTIVMTTLILYVENLKQKSAQHLNMNNAHNNG